jgi:hypothetical protein
MREEYALSRDALQNVLLKKAESSNGGFEVVW